MNHHDVQIQSDQKKKLELDNVDGNVNVVIVTMKAAHACVHALTFLATSEFTKPL